MNLNWSNRVIKYVLFVFNFIFVITGIVMIAVGVSVKDYYTDYDVFLNGSYFSLPNLLIAIGSLIFFISFFGCCGAAKESWFMIFIFSILLSLIFIMEFSAGIAGYVLRDQTSSFLSDKLKESMAQYTFTPDKTNPTTVMWDEIQRDFKCCGAVGPTDWRDIVPTASPESTTLNETSEPSSSASTSEQSSSETASTTPTTTSSTSPSVNETSKDADSMSITKKPKRSVTDTKEDSFDLPASCCQIKSGTTGSISCNTASNTTTVNTKGCVEGFGAYLKGHAVTLGGVGIAIAFLQLFGVIFACHLSRQLKHGFYST